MQRATRYHPWLVALHWTAAVLSIAALYFGRMHLVKIPNSDPVKIQGLRVHMTVGMLILVLVVARLVVRNVTARPRKAETRPHFLAVLASLSHGLLYFCLMGMTLSGLALGYQGGLFGAVFAHQGTVPPDLWVYWPRTGHYLFSRLLMFLIALHICGAMYHTLILKDGLLRRMGFGARNISSP